jgi:hypothetical protein
MLPATDVIQRTLNLARRGARAKACVVPPYIRGGVSLPHRTLNARLLSGTALDDVACDISWAIP